MSEWLSNRKAIAEAMGVTEEEVQRMADTSLAEPEPPHVVPERKPPKRVLLFVGGEGIDVPPDWPKHIERILRKEMRFTLGKAFHVILVDEETDLKEQCYGFFHRDWEREYAEPEAVVPEAVPEVRTKYVQLNEAVARSQDAKRYPWLGVPAHGEDLV